MIEIKVFWNKVIDDPSQPFGTRVLPEYQVKETFRVNNTISDLRERWKTHKNMNIQKDIIIEDCGRSYGIHTYKEIREVQP
jgi:hypothetical protein